MTDQIIFAVIITGLVIIILMPFLVNTWVLCSLRKNLIRTFSSLEEKYPDGVQKGIQNVKDLKDDELTSSYLDLQKLKLTISSEFSKELPQRKGLTRFTIMSAVIFIIGTTIIYFIITGESAELLKSTLTILTGAFTTIIGFYFGGRAEELKNEELKEISKSSAGDSPKR